MTVLKSLSFNCHSTMWKRIENNKYSTLNCAPGYVGHYDSSELSFNGYLALAIVLQLYALSGLMIRWSSHPCQLLGIFVVFKNSLSFCKVILFYRVIPFSLFRVVDINECGSGSNDCHVNATCYNQPGSYYCQCKEGFVGSGKHCEGRNLIMLYRTSALYEKHKVHTA